MIVTLSLKSDDVPGPTPVVVHMVLPKGFPVPYFWCTHTHALTWEWGEGTRCIRTSSNFLQFRPCKDNLRTRDAALGACLGAGNDTESGVEGRNPRKVIWLAYCTRPHAHASPHYEGRQAKLNFKNMLTNAVRLAGFLS